MFQLSRHRYRSSPLRRVSYLFISKHVDEVVEREAAFLQHDVSGAFDTLTGQKQQLVSGRIADQPPDLNTHRKHSQLADR